ncbi:prepilin peptidase [Paenibacillus cymbidii]|uniref:prepilin peptidase n=1 Tax=Paenibacillus cymbidii TaxID=1639034 RepID=UPI00108217B3|nr:A24 family peptidase [Paenibacillus cymbidii]
MTQLKTILEEHQTILVAVVAIFGLLIGSFLNVVAIRVPKRESIAFPPSHCMHCKHRLGPLDLVPVLSWLLLRGRCRYCHGAISPQYPAGEAATALLFAFMAWQIGVSAELLPALLLVSILVAITLSDLRYMIIPDRVLLFGYMAGLLLRVFIHPLPLWNYVAASLIGCALLYAIAWGSVALLGREGMGGGDIKLFAFLGLLLGIKMTLLTLYLACMIGLLYGLTLLATSRFKRGQPIAFGPFIAAAAILAYGWGDEWLHAVWTWLVPEG